MCIYMYINTKMYMYLRLVKKSFYVNLLLFLFLLLLVQLQHLVETQVRYISCTIIKIGYQMQLAPIVLVIMSVQLD